MQKALKALLVADESLGASEIIERADISGRSYTRNIDELAALGMVESVGNGGHKEWQAWIIPWWSPLAGVDAPRIDDSDENAVTSPSRWDDVLYDIALGLGLNPEYELFAGPVDIDKVFAALPALEQWRGFIETHYGLTDIEDRPPIDTGRLSAEAEIDAEDAVEIGSCPPSRENAQLSFSSL